MALEEFWRNVRRAVTLIRPSAIADSPRISTEEISRSLASADLWLVRGAVGGYDEKDFPFLSPEELSRLTAAVQQFRDVAVTVSPRGPATRQQIETARPAFQSIVELLEFDRFADADAFRIGKEIERRLAPDRPAELAELRFETGPDSTGDPGLWVWAFVAESGEHRKDVFFGAVDKIEPHLGPIAWDVASGRQPYILFRSTLDQLAPEAAAR